MIDFEKERAKLRKRFAIRSAVIFIVSVMLIIGLYVFVSKQLDKLDGHVRLDIQIKNDTINEN